MTDTNSPAPNRLINEAHRAAKRLEFAAIGQAGATGIAASKLIDHPDSWLLWLGAVTAVLTVPATWICRNRQLDRAHWLATTDQWWKQLDEMPRREPFPALVDWIDTRTDHVRKLASSRRSLLVGRRVSADPQSRRPAEG